MTSNYYIKNYVSLLGQAYIQCSAVSTKKMGEVYSICYLVCKCKEFSVVYNIFYQE
jgi:hypothetical protein